MLTLGVLATFLWYMTVPAPHRKDVVGNIGLTMLGLVWIPVLAGSLLIILTTFETAGRGRRDRSDVRVRHRGVPDRLGLGRFVRPAAARARDEPEEVDRGTDRGIARHRDRLVGFRHGVRRRRTGIFEERASNAVLLGLVVSLAATFGDLAESLVKRDVGVKDMGSVLPGHGGVLDRIDSLLFVAPAALLLLRIIAY